MRVMSWIAEACRKAETPTDVYARYPDFVQDTGSEMKLETFKRRVRDVMYDTSGELPKPEARPRIMQEADGPNLNIVSTSHEIRTLDQLLAYCKVDMARWKVRKHTVNSWGSEANENFQVKAWLEPRDTEVDPRAEIEEMVEEAATYMPKYPDWTPKLRDESGNLFEITLFDHHFGQLSWGRETRGGNYDAGIARSLALDAVDYLLSRAREVKIERIVLPIGNDFFNVNSMLNITTAGTPQSEDGRWKKTFVRGRRLWIEIIERCLTVAPVEVIGVLGNHDEERSFYMVDSLACWFGKHTNVIVDNGPEDRKYYRWGGCLLGFTHGHKERRGKGVLVNIMATEKPVDWSETRYREWHKGHLHAASGQSVQFLDEELGVRERILPSLVALDDYHSGKGYSHLRESTGFVWNDLRGNTDIFMYHPEG